MIKIHAGKYKNQFINRVKINSTKETASMVREAVFNSLYNINGTVLDLFAGSGSYGITSFSLGAKEVYFVEKNNKAFLTIKNNLNKLNIKGNLYKGDYKNFLKSNKVKFDYIFLDPPYDFNNYEELLNNVYYHLNSNGHIVLEVFKNTNIVIDNDKYFINKDKNYGSKRIIILIVN